jgi:hypothetical protein
LVSITKSFLTRFWYVEKLWSGSFLWSYYWTCWRVHDTHVNVVIGISDGITFDLYCSGNFNYNNDIWWHWLTQLYFMRHCVEVVAGWFDCTSVKIDPMHWCCFWIGTIKYKCKFWYSNVTWTSIVYICLFFSLKWANSTCITTNWNKLITIFSQLINHHVVTFKSSNLSSKIDKRLQRTC